MAIHSESRKARIAREKTSRELEREVESTRESIHETLDELESRLSPGELLDQAVGYLRRSGPREFARNLARSVNENPLPVVLTAAGLGWLMVSSSRPRYAHYAIESGDGEDLGEVVGAAADLVGRKLAEAGDRGRDVIRDVGAAAESASEAAGRVRRETAYRARQLRHGFERTLDEEPLLVGVASFAIAALCAAILPPTRPEDEAFGELRDQTLERAGEIGVEKAREVAEHVEQGVREAGERMQESAERHSPGFSGS